MDITENNNRNLLLIKKGSWRYHVPVLDGLLTSKKEKNHAQSCVINQQCAHTHVASHSCLILVFYSNALKALLSKETA